MDWFLILRFCWALQEKKIFSAQKWGVELEKSVAMFTFSKACFDFSWYSPPGDKAGEHKINFQLQSNMGMTERALASVTFIVSAAMQAGKVEVKYVLKNFNLHRILEISWYLQWHH